MEIKTATSVFLATCLIIAVSGCLQKPESTVPTSPLQSPLDTSMSTDSPLPTGEPPETQPGDTEIERFQLNKPIPPGSKKVTGSGPPGVPIVLLDITFGGRLLASGVIGKQGKFELTVEEPLEARHRLGITLGDLSGTKWTPEDLSDEKLYGDDALSVPQVGFFYDTHIIQE
jgi:hypothetical protein